MIPPPPLRGYWPFAGGEPSKIDYGLLAIDYSDGLKPILRKNPVNAVNPVKKTSWFFVFFVVKNII